MSHRDEMLWCPNPFSTRFIRPGAIPYRFPSGQTAEVLVAKLAALGWRGQIIGPHGSGKSTLLASLLEPLRRAGRPGWMICLHDGQRRLPRDWTAQAVRAAASLVIIDGYEQLSAWSRVWVKWHCRRRGWGLLVTAHDEAGFPTLLRSVAGLRVAQDVVDRLLPAGDDSIDEAIVAAHFAAARGNVREMLFGLYDHHERQRRGACARRGIAR